MSDENRLYMVQAMCTDDKADYRAMLRLTPPLPTCDDRDILNAIIEVTT